MKKNKPEFIYPWEAPVSELKKDRFDRIIGVLSVEGFADDIKNAPKAPDATKKRVTQLVKLLYKYDNILLACPSSRLLQGFLNYLLLCWALTVEKRSVHLRSADLRKLIKEDLDDAENYRDLLTGQPLVWENLELCEGFAFKKVGDLIQELLLKRSRSASLLSYKGPLYKAKNIFTIICAEPEEEIINKLLTERFGASVATFILDTFQLAIIDGDVPPRQVITI